MSFNRTNANQQLKVDAISSDLKRRSRQSARITVASQPLKLALGIASSVVLPRLLAPSDFGLLAMVAPLLTLVDSVNNLGLETATIQRQNLNQGQASQIFWLSLKINGVTIASMLLIAPVLAWFYQRQELIGMTLVLAVGIMAVCLTFQHRSLLKRQMRFETITAIELNSTAAGVGVAVGGAMLGWGYWALVLQIVITQLIQSFASWIVCGWRPEKYTKQTELDDNLRQMLVYGLNLTGFRFITRLGMHLDRILIGYWIGAETLGYYQLAYTWAYLPFELIYHPLFDVAVSSLSRTQHDLDMYRSYARRVLQPIFAFCMPVLAFGFVCARDLIVGIAGSQWLPAVPLFRLLAIAAGVGSMYRVTKWLYLSIGQTRRQLRWGILHTSVMILAVAIGSRWGEMGVAGGYTVGITLLTFPAVAFCLRTSPLSMADFFSTVWRPALASITAAIAFQFTNPFLININHNILNLILKFIVFSLLYFLFFLVFLAIKKIIQSMFLDKNNNKTNRKN